MRIAEAILPVGITPAHAGKRVHKDMPLRTAEDHPRTRGEKCKACRDVRRRRGSPPHTRGKVRMLQHTVHIRGITPAHAGKSRLKIQCPVSVRDHPRTRGEKLFCRPSFRSIGGSPPHTRGKGTFSASVSFWHGITPAHAGKRKTGRLEQERDEDHPRTRGEKVPEDWKRP